MIVRAIKTSLFHENQNLVDFLIRNFRDLRDEDIVVVTSKIVALSEGRAVTVNSEKEKELLIRSESEMAIKTKYVWLTVKDNMVMASAGIDESNANGKIILLPRDSFAAAKTLRAKLMKENGLKKLGVLITDSRTMPLRAGVTGVALGYAGFGGIRDYRGKEDLFGRKLCFSRTDVADSLATAAVLEMGEGSERCPLALIRGAAVSFCGRVNRDELRIDLQEDMYLPFFAQLPKQK